MKKKEEKKATFSPASTGRMRGFSIYNSEGNIYYKREVERVAMELRQELYPAPKQEETVTTPAPVAVKNKNKIGYAFPLVAILILAVLSIVIMVLSCFGLEGIKDFAPFYTLKNTGKATSVSILDGIMAMLGRSQLNYSVNEDGATGIMLIVFAVAGGLYGLLTVVQMIKAIVALAYLKKKPQKRIRFGVIAFLSVISLVIVLISMICLKGQFGFGDLCSLLFPAALGDYGLPRGEEGYTLYSGFGLYFLIVAPLLSMIFSSCIYKKGKVGEKDVA